MDNELTATAEKIKAAQAAQTSRLRQLYPVGTRWAFFISHGQKNPSTGKVTGHVPDIYGGHVVLDHEQAKAGGRYRWRHVHPDKILHQL